MRNVPLKFRAWDPAAKDFMIGFYIQNDTGAIYTEGGSGELWSEEGDIILEQYTGLKDKNGKEIYEGDVVVADWHWESPHVIELPDDYYAFSEFALGDALTVLGNVHENPELEIHR